MFLPAQIPYATQKNQWSKRPLHSKILWSKMSLVLSNDNFRWTSFCKSPSRFLMNSLQMLLYSEHSHKPCSTDSHPHSQKNSTLHWMYMYMHHCVHLVCRSLIWLLLMGREVTVFVNCYWYTCTNDNSKFSYICITSIYSLQLYLYSG